MRIEIWFGKTIEAKHLPPGLPVHTLRWKDTEGIWGTSPSEHPDGLLCDVAWSHKPAGSDHFWLAGRHWGPRRSDVRIVSMPFGEYLRLHLAECSPMNPFYGLGRAEFLARWTALHGPVPKAAVA